MERRKRQEDREIERRADIKKENDKRPRSQWKAREEERSRREGEREAGRFG